jgi:hypothetical protein
MRTTTLYLQADLNNQKNNFKKRISLRLVDLKKNFSTNSREIFELEEQLSLLIESELREELSNFKIFDKLNNEKITPHFMRMTKTMNNEPDLDTIKIDNPDFINVENNEAFIMDFYETLYKIGANPNPNMQNTISIDESLGEVKDNEHVIGSKISENEKNFLDRQLPMTEFDRAMDTCNKKSALGTDGLSNNFTRCFWQYLRVPLLKYANCCFEKGNLTNSFRTAKIRLIPKKGDLKKITNWRPISLLNCFYKLISRVITNRLRKVIDKITKVGQYGYSNTKQCQEVLIGLLGEIHLAKNTGTKGILVSLDIKKAFDSISHDY